MMNFIITILFTPACLWIPEPADVVGGEVDTEADGDVDADSDADADADADSDADSDTGASAPTINGLTLTEVGEEVDLAIVITDSDGDVEGGILTVSIDGERTEYAMPAGLSSWDASSGTATVRAPFAPCQHGTTLSITAIAEDEAGHASEPAERPLSLSGTSLSVLETGDLGSAYAHVSTSVTPIYVCGDLYGGGSSLGDSDVDLVALDLDAGQTLWIDLYWLDDGITDLNARNYSGVSDPITYHADHSTGGTSPPEALGQTGSDIDQSLWYSIWGVTGSSGEWWLVVR